MEIPEELLKQLCSETALRVSRYGFKNPTPFENRVEEGEKTGSTYEFYKAVKELHKIIYGEEL